MATTTPTATTQLDAARARMQARQEDAVRREELRQAAIESKLRQAFHDLLGGDPVLAVAMTSAPIVSTESGAGLAFSLDLPVLAGEVHRVPMRLCVDMNPDEADGPELLVELGGLGPFHQSREWCGASPESFWETLVTLVDRLVGQCADMDLPLPESWALVETL